MADRVIIVGGGIFGLSVGWAALRAGMDVEIFEAAIPGAGSSGGVVGALTPHAPTRWRPMMAFQFEALNRLPAHMAALAEASGIDPGYARPGRVTPLKTEKALARAEADLAAAPEVWGDQGTMRIDAKVPEALGGWIAPEAAPFGIQRDTVSGRVDPRAYVQALARVLAPNLRLGQWVDAVDDGPAIRANGKRYSADHVVLAGGAAGWDLVPAAHRGGGVKGQAAVLAADASGLPVIYQDGLYVVAHGAGRVAVGSTSEKVFDDGAETDARLDDVLERARAACPVLANAPVLERWAGVRPRPPGREPVVGPVPGRAGLWLATGGYKISFGIAHQVGDALAAMMRGNVPDLPLPETFFPQDLCADQTPGD